MASSCRERENVDDVIAVLGAEFDADPSIVAADLAAFLHELEREGMVNAPLRPWSASARLAQRNCNW